MSFGSSSFPSLKRSQKKGHWIAAIKAIAKIALPMDLSLESAGRDSSFRGWAS